MRGFVIGMAWMSLAIPAAMADPAPAQSPAQLEKSAPAAPAPGMPSQKNKAAAKQEGKAQTTAQLAAKKPLDNGHDDGGAAKQSTALGASTNVDNGHDDGGAAQ